MPPKIHPPTTRRCSRRASGRSAAELGADPADPWARFPDGSLEGELCAAAAERLRRDPQTPRQPPAVPVDAGRGHRGTASTRRRSAAVFVDLGHKAPEVAERVVTVSPDVGTSMTNLGAGSTAQASGIHRSGSTGSPTTPTRWSAGTRSQQGQHLELGIAEVNLVGVLGELGATWSRDGEPLLPIGTIYDPFVNRAVEPWSFGIYAGGRSILVGTPSGVSLAPEGAQSSAALGRDRAAWLRSLGAAFRAGPRVGPARRARAARAARRRIRLPRLSTRPIDQSLAAVPEDPGS
ncbi:MAG: hypothetical protein U0R26_10975 [Solirubrobacterales bacterium]